MMSAKVATPALLKVKVFWNKDYYVIYFVYDVTNKILSKLDNSSFCIREVIITSILWGFDHKNRFFEGLSWFKFNNVGLELDINFRFYTSLSKGLKLKVKKLWGLTPTFVEVAGEKMVGRLPSPPTILNRVKAAQIWPSCVVGMKVWENSKPVMCKNGVFKCNLIIEFKDIKVLKERVSMCFSS